MSGLSEIDSVAGNERSFGLDQNESLTMERHPRALVVPSRVSQ
jgi:hypothetical protein